MSETMTGPGWEPKIIGPKEIAAIRTSFQFCNLNKVSDEVVDTMVEVMDGTAYPETYPPEERKPYPGLRIVTVADLRAMCEFIVACNDEFKVPSDVMAVGNRLAGAIGDGA